MERIWLRHYPAGVPADIDPASCPSLVALFEDSFARYAARPCCRCMGRTLSYAKLDEASRALAGELQARGLERGTRVAVMMPNILQYPIAIVAILRAGFTVVNVNPLYTSRELEFQLNDAGAEAIIVLENFASVLQEALPRTPVKHIIVASLGDMLGTVKGTLVNGVVRHVKKMVPALSPAGRDRLQRGAENWPRAEVQTRGRRARRRRLPAIYRRHHRRLQGRDAAASQPGRQCPAGGSLERADGGDAAAHRPDRHPHRAAALSYLRAHRLFPVRHATRGHVPADPQPARHRRADQGTRQREGERLPGGEHAVQRAAASSGISARSTGRCSNTRSAAAWRCRRRWRKPG